MRRTSIALLCVAALWAPAARAQTTSPDAAVAPSAEARAEANRLSDDLEKLAKRQVWSGVEKRFRELETLGVPLSQQDYLYGAYAARELGDVVSAYERLQSAARLGGSKEIVDWLWDIDHNYGNVELMMVPSRSVELVPEEMPLDPNQRKAVEAAVKAARDDGAYRGLLPQGKYSFAGVPFSAQPGVSVRIEVNPKTRKRGPAEPLIRYPQAPITQPGPSAPAPTTGGTSAPAEGSSSTGSTGSPPETSAPAEPPTSSPSEQPQE